VLDVEYFELLDIDDPFNTTPAATAITAAAIAPNQKDFQLSPISYSSL